jgi:hypothetical protein
MKRRMRRFEYIYKKKIEVSWNVGGSNQAKK